jgi:hypothetical protein
MAARSFPRFVLCQRMTSVMPSKAYQDLGFSLCLTRAGAKPNFFAGAYGTADRAAKNPELRFLEGADF